MAQRIFPENFIFQPISWGRTRNSNLQHERAEPKQRFTKAGAANDASSNAVDEIAESPATLTKTGVYEFHAAHEIEIPHSIRFGVPFDYRS